MPVEQANRGRGDQGISVILLALVAVLLLTISALVLDLGNGRSEKRKMQNAVDAAALAAARDLSISGSKPCTTAMNYVRNNLRLAPSGGDTTCSTTTTDTAAKLRTTITYPVSGVGSYNQNSIIRVKACRDVDTFFASIIGVSSVEVCAQATAKNTFNETEDNSETGTGGCKDAKKDTCGVTNPIGNWKSKCQAILDKGAVPTVDGRAPLPGKGTPDYILQNPPALEGYVAIGDLGVGAIKLGKMLFSCDDDEYFFGMTFNALSLGNVANENVYGLGTYHQTYQTGWSSGALGTRVNSEHAIFEFRCGNAGSVISHFEQQYVDQNMPNGGGATISSSVKGTPDGQAPNATGTSFVWNWNHTNITGYSQADMKLHSPNFDPTYPDAPDTPAAIQNWEWPMSYEFSISRSAFDSCVSADPIIQVITIHNSPGKTSAFTNVFGQETVGVALVE